VYLLIAHAQTDGEGFLWVSLNDLANNTCDVLVEQANDALPEPRQ
jgi:hypothetical protein